MRLYICAFLFCCVLRYYAFGKTVKFPDNPDLFEGDIKLSAEQEKAVKRAIETHKSIEDGSSKFGLTNVYPPWTNGVVVYSLASSIGSRQLSAIRAAMNEWTTKTKGCISFKKRTNERNYLEFHVGSGCWGHIGEPNGKSQISVGAGCEYQHVMSHEIGHSLGFWHEQSRTDRDEYLQVLWQNVPPAFKEAFAKYGKDKIDSLGVPYDYTSIMHYPWNAFSTTGRDTVKPLKRVPSPGPYKFISKTDVQQARLFYKCDTTKPVYTKAPPPVTRCVTETVVNARANAANCRDLNTNCDSWKRRGECSRNPRYMIPNCCKSCTGGNGGCADKSTSCNSWARNGYCQRSRAYMKSNCAKSCNLCETVTKKKCYTLPPPKTTPSATTTEELVTPPIPETDQPTPPIPETDQPTPPIPETDQPTPPVPNTDKPTGIPPTKPQPPPTSDDCKKMSPLGIADSNKVDDSMLSAPTSESQWHAPQFGRLNQAKDNKSVGSWCAAIQDKNQYFEVTMEKPKLLGGLKIQGRPSDVDTQYQKFVKKFTITYWNHYVTNWIDVNFVFGGNTDGSTVKEINFEIPIKTNVIRIKPTEWQHMICLRLELMTCV